MNRVRRFLTGLLTFCVFFQMFAITGHAAEGDSDSTAKPYTYTVTFYAGNQGKFTGTNEVQVMDETKAPVSGNIVKSIRDDGSAITVKGLKAGYQVTFDNIQSEEENAPVKREENSQYYVKGLRKGGYDNDDTAPSFTVEQDQDYVVAYGIKGDMVSYVIRYEDRAGNTLAPSRTYYGNVGDRPVVAFLYIAGYEPQAYNLTRELSKNEADNVFTFIYTRVAGSGVTEEVIDEGTTVMEVPGETQGTAGGVGNPEASDAGAAADGGAGENEDLADEDIPLSDGPQDLIDLDDEETPLANRLGSLEGATDLLGAVVVGVSGAAALIALIIILMKRRRKEAEEVNGR